MGVLYYANTYAVFCVCRPLPDEMLKYAQADTHYLLYVYDRVRTDLYDVGNGQPALIQQVWAKSRDLSLKVWTDLFMPAN